MPTSSAAEHLAIVVANRRVAHRHELRGFCIGPHVGGGYALRDGGLERRVTRREIFAATEVGAVATERNPVGVDDRHQSRRHLVEDGLLTAEDRRRLEYSVASSWRALTVPARKTSRLAFSLAMVASHRSVRTASSSSLPLAAARARSASPFSWAGLEARSPEPRAQEARTKGHQPKGQ